MRPVLAIHLFCWLFLGALVLAGCSSDTAPVTSSTAPSLDNGVDLQSGRPFNACWGQATKVFALMREMGYHASEQEEPRAGLRNLARQLADDGVIPDDSMASLGAFVADALDLSIEACED